jgi:hypothetical protein
MRPRRVVCRIAWEGTAMTTAATANITRTASLERVEPKSRTRLGRQADSRTVKQALDRVLSIPFAAATHRDCADVPFFCG